MSTTAPGPLVSPDWLQDNLDDPGLQVIENAWFPDSYLKAHIRGAVRLPCHPHIKRFDADGERTQHVMEPAEFAALCYAMGLRRQKHYVLYDDHHGLFAARFWCVCRYFGLDNVSILDGSWHGWLAQGRPVTTRPQDTEFHSCVRIPSLHEVQMQAVSAL